MVAFPLLTQGETNVTEIGIVAGALFIRTGTVTLLVPYAEIVGDPRAIVPRLTVAPPTDIPTAVLVDVIPPTVAEAVILVAPEELMPAVFN